MKHKVYFILLVVNFILILLAANNCVGYIIGEKYQVVSIRMDETLSEEEQNIKIENSKIELEKGKKQSSFILIGLLIIFSILFFLMLKNKRRVINKPAC